MSQAHPWLLFVWRSAQYTALVGVSMLALTGCEVDFEVDRPDTFSCQTNADCVAPFICVIGESGAGVCTTETFGPASNTSTGPTCVDADNDGFGENCSNGADCDDNDPDVYPEAPELCDGKDNDCDCERDAAGAAVDCEIGVDLDEVNPCETDADCPDDPEASNGMVCEANVCRYACNLTVGVCNGKTTACTTAVEGSQTIGQVLDCSVPGEGGIPAYGPDYQAVSESMEQCDMLDNNCNGQVDDNATCRELVCDPDNPEPCSTDLGRCSAGELECADGMVGACLDPNTGDPVTLPGDFNEVCDGVDDDCDGVVDNAAGSSVASSICPNCPFGMVLVTNTLTGDRFCMDRYEASRPDATATDAGEGLTARAVSQPGVLPWTNIDVSAAQNACRGGDERNTPPLRASKRLCTLSEITFACSGATEATYPYGDTYDGALCNGADAGLGALAPTGPTDDEEDIDFAGCSIEHNGQLVYDLSGNAAELVVDGVLPRVFGGSFESAEEALTCGSNGEGQGAQEISVGFRCCFDAQ